MDSNESLVNAYIESCRKLNFPIQGISIDDLLRKISAGENFIYFASDEQKLEIMSRTASNRLLYFGNGNKPPRIYRITNYFDEDESIYTFCEGWMPATSKEEVKDSVEYYAYRRHCANHGYYLIDLQLQPINISELI